MNGVERYKLSRETDTHHVGEIQPLLGAFYQISGVAALDED